MFAGGNTTAAAPGNLVAISAHADDAELNAGGTLAKWVAAGGHVHLVMATNNCSGSMIPANGDEAARARLPPDATTRIRHREQEAAAALLCASVHYLDYAPRHYWDGQRRVSLGVDDALPRPAGFATQPLILLACTEPAHVARLAALLVSLQPAAVLTQTPNDRDPEHHAVAALVWQAFASEPRLKATPLRFWTPSTSSPGGLMTAPYDHFEDITAFYQQKLALCACHASQMTARRYDIVARRAAYWGRRMGVAYAEPFHTAHWDEQM